MELLGFELRRFRVAFRAGFLKRLFQKHLLQQIEMVEALGIALQQGNGRQRTLLRVQLPGFGK